MGVAGVERRRRGPRGAPWLRNAGILALAIHCVACGRAPTMAVLVGSRPLTRIPAVDDCDDFGTSPLELDPNRPLTVLVHGCTASSGQYRPLASVFETHGHQTSCFSYDDRDRIDTSSGQLIESLDALSSMLDGQPITVIGHSQGGLVARRALVGNRQDGRRPPARGRYRLVTVSSPLNGIRASEHCGMESLHVLAFGLTYGICMAITGDSWEDIHPRSELVRRPGVLASNVVEYVRVVTDERDTCRRYGADGRCRQDDYVFSLEEQRNPHVDSDPRVTNVQIRAGHANVIGRPGVPPTELIRVFREHQILSDAPRGGSRALSRLLAALYGPG